MKKYFLLLVLLSLFMPFVTAQTTSLEKGNLQFKMGGGLYLGGNFSSTDFDTKSIDGGFDGANQGIFSLHYNTHTNFSLGINLLNQKHYVKDAFNENSSIYSSLGLSIQYYFLNRPKSNIYFDVTANKMGVEVYKSKIDPQTQKETKEKFIADKGHYNAFSLGVNKYFGHRFGFYAQLGYTCFKDILLPGTF